ncbi:NAD(P)-dependent oxidoreductase, partial [Campylobacter concisus]|uniref:NAD(P)-dependent oxidoreductase n=1 Tax=Campylobacter concisus TaxID=199 RepID=UPI0023DE0421
AKSGKISYIGIDVFAKEPSTSNPLLDLENLSPTPHLGANTYESQRNIAIAAAEQAIDAARGLGYPNALNLPIKTEEIPPFAVPYVDLITKMAYFASQLNKSPIRAIRLEADGKIAEFSKSLLTFAIVGALKESMGEKINYVNANFQADDKGIITD